MKDNAFSRSVVDDDQADAWSEVDGIAAAEPMGVTIVNGVADDGTQVDLTLFGVIPDGFLAPATSDGSSLGPVHGIVVSEPLREAGLAGPGRPGEDDQAAVTAAAPRREMPTRPPSGSVERSQGPRFPAVRSAASPR